MPARSKFAASPMTGAQLAAFRTRRGLSLQALAERLGTGIQTLKEYERGVRGDPPRPVLIPRSIMLALVAIELGYSDYDGRPLIKQDGPDPHGEGSQPKRRRRGRPIGSKYTELEE